MVINFDSLLVIAFEARLKGLTHLWIWGNFTTSKNYWRMRYDLYPKARKRRARKDDDDDSEELRLSRVVDNNLIPESLFCQLPEVTYHLSLPHAMDFTQKCWHLVLDNIKTLQSLRFMKPSQQTLLRLAPPGRVRDYLYLRKDSMKFLVGVLKGMEGRLEEAQLGPQAEDFLLQFVGRPRGRGWGIGQEGGGERSLENVRSLHYCGLMGAAIYSLLNPPTSNENNDSSNDNQYDSNINTTVEKLTLHMPVSLPRLRDLLLVFPNLQELCSWNHSEGHGFLIGLQWTSPILSSSPTSST